MKTVNFINTFGLKLAFVIAATLIAPVSIADKAGEKNSAQQTQTIALGNSVDMELAQSLDSVMADPEQFQGQTITLQGTVSKVCKKKGCWADIETENATIRVKVPDDEIVIPIYAVGRKAYATGILSAKNLSKEQTVRYLEHMAKDAGEDFDPESVETGMTLYQLKADAVKIL